MNSVCVLGLGYIGLPTASILATHGFTVIGVDVNEKVIARLKEGKPHIQEPGLRTIVEAAVKSGNLNIAHHQKDPLFVKAEETLIEVGLNAIVRLAMEDGELR